MRAAFREALCVVVIAALSACGGSGGSIPKAATAPPSNGAPSGSTPSGDAFAASNVKIHEIGFPGPWTGSLGEYDVAALGVSPAGTVYFGEGGGNGKTSLLYSYSAGTFAQTQPAYGWCPANAADCCGANGPCSGNGVTAIGAQSTDPNKIFWGGETAPEGVPSGLIFMGAGQKATAPPAPYNSMQPVNATYFLSLVTDESGTLWDGGGGGYGAFGYPANLSSLSCDTSAGDSRVNCWDALWLANGPNHHVWGYMHVEPSSNRQGWPVLPSQTTGSVILEFAPSGQILQSYNVAGFIGGISRGGDGALWFTNQTSNQVERITGSGSITQFAIPTSNSGASSITAAADGALWFIESNDNKVARVDTSGSFTEFTLPTANAGPVAIGADPFGGGCNPNVIWVLEGNSAQLAEITY